MKTRLITLLTMGHTVDGVRDRKGAYTLRYVNKFPKFGPVARVAAAGAPRAGHSAPTAQASLFGAAKAPAAVAAAVVAVAPAIGRADGTDGKNGTDRTEQQQRFRALMGWFRWFAKLGAFLVAVVAFVPKTAARVRGRLRRSPAAEARPRAQAELALDKVTVLRNDLSDADLVVVAVEQKPEDSRAARAETPEPAGNPWKRAAARWITLKNPAEDASLPPNALAEKSRAGSPPPAAGRRGSLLRGAVQWAQTPP